MVIIGRMSRALRHRAGRIRFPADRARLFHIDEASPASAAPRGWLRCI
jgi:hypothetical protein